MMFTRLDLNLDFFSFWNLINDRYDISVDFDLLPMECPRYLNWEKTNLVDFYISNQKYLVWPKSVNIFCLNTKPKCIYLFIFSFNYFKIKHPGIRYLLHIDAHLKITTTSFQNTLE